jgi:hypothetical protein
MNSTVPRPKLDDAMKLAVAKEIAQKIFAGEPETDIDEAAAQLAKHGRSHSDGYELARALDSHCGWFPNAEMVEELDNFAWLARNELEKAEKDWATTNAIQPPLPDGTRVRLRSGETGVIDRVYEYGAARYAIILDGDARSAPPTNSRRIVNFEDVTQEESTS